MGVDILFIGGFFIEWVIPCECIFHSSNPVCDAYLQLTKPETASRFDYCFSISSIPYVYVERKWKKKNPRRDTMTSPPILTPTPMFMNGATFVYWSGMGDASISVQRNRKNLGGGFDSTLAMGFWLLVIHRTHLLQALLSFGLSLWPGSLRRNKDILIEIAAMTSLEGSPTQVTNRTIEAFTLWWDTRVPSEYDRARYDSPGTYSCIRAMAVCQRRVVAENLKSTETIRYKTAQILRMSTTRKERSSCAPSNVR